MMIGRNALVADWVAPPWWLRPFARRVRRWYFSDPFAMWMEIEWRLGRRRDFP